MSAKARRNSSLLYHVALLLLLTLPPSFSGRSGSRNKTKSACDFQGQMTASFLSLNFINNLTWKIPENAKGLQYTVQYGVYGSKLWQKKLECTGIKLTWCDLTNETNETKEYYGKVIINNKNCSVKTERFRPLFDTEIGPPTVNLNLGNASIEIQLTHPVKSLHKIFKGVMYHIYVNDKERKIEEPYYKIENIDPNTRYCVTAEVYWFNKNSVRSEKTCITTNADHTSEQTIKGMLYILPVTAIFCTLFIIGYATHKYIHGSNLKHPTLLNITTSNNKNAILVDAHTVTINLISIESGKPSLQDTMVPGEEDNKEFQKQTHWHITEGKDHINCDSGVTEEAEEESNNDYGYVSLQEQVIIPRPTISPYDMPHHLHEDVTALSTSTNACEIRDPYGYSKSNDSAPPVQENDELDSVPNVYASVKTTVSYPYFSQGDSDFANVDTLKEDVCELEELFMGQELERLNVIEDTGPNDSSMLFVDWSPEDSPLYLPNLSKKRELENCIKQCQKEQEGLLSQLYLPSEAQETTKDDELGQLEERWGLLIKDTEK